MRNRDNESGQALVLVALSMAVLMGFMALAIDVGLLFRSRRNLQIAADAAATAAAVNYLYYGNVSSAKTAAIAAAAANGVSIVDNDIHTPPLYGPYTGATAGSYFEVIPQQAVGTTFMGVITHTNTMKVAARAVAGTPTAGKACIYITGTGAGVFDMQGNATINAPGCGVYVNSNNSGAVSITGGSASVNAAYFDITAPTYTGKSTAPTNPTPNSPPQSDPLGDIAGPNPNPTPPATTDCPTGASGNTVTVAAVISTTPLPVLNGITCFSSANVNLSADLPGGRIYVFENGVKIGASITVGSSTNGATLDIYQGSFNQANPQLTVYAPTSGPYNGIAIMQPAGNANQLQVQFGSGGQTLDGMIYAPGAQVYLQDHGGGVTATGIIALKMMVKSSTVNIPSYNLAHPTTSPLKTVTLVE